MAAVSVSDQTGGHGTATTPAPLEVAHGVLVQLPCCYQRASATHTSRGELHTALSSDKTVQGNNDRDDRGDQN